MSKVNREKKGRILSSNLHFNVPPTTDFVHSFFSLNSKYSVFDIFTLIVALGNVFLVFYYKPPRVYVLLSFLFWRLLYNFGIGSLLYMQSKSKFLIKLANKYNLKSRYTINSDHSIVQESGSNIPEVNVDGSFNLSTPKKRIKIRTNNKEEALNVDQLKDSNFNNDKKLEKYSFKFILSQFLRNQVEIKMSNTYPNYKYDDYPTEFNIWILFRGVVDIILINDFTCYMLFALSYWDLKPLDQHNIYDLIRYSIGFLMLLFNLWIKTDAHRVVKDFAWYWGDFFFLIDDNLLFDGVFEMAPHPMYSVGYIGFYAASLISSSYWVLFISLLAHSGQMLFLHFVETPHIEKIYNPPKLDQNNESFSSYYTKKFGSRDMIWFMNMDLYRSSDLITFIASGYLLFNAVFIVGLFRNLDDNPIIGIFNWKDLYYFLQSFIWSTIHIFGTSFILYKEIRRKDWTRHFIKQGGTPNDAFNSWKAISNFTQLMSHVSFGLAVLYFTIIPNSILDDIFLLRLTLGILIIILHIYVIISTIDVIGTTGWFYGDFFLEELRLSSGPTYNGLYRYINNPLLFMFTSWGLAIISGSSYIWGLAIYQQFLNWIFVQCVENPAMNILYKDKLQKEAGVERVFKTKLQAIQSYLRSVIAPIFGLPPSIDTSEIIVNQNSVEELALRSPPFKRLKVNTDNEEYFEMMDRLEKLASNAKPSIKLLLSDTVSNLSKILSRAHLTNTSLINMNYAKLFTTTVVHNPTNNINSKNQVDFLYSNDSINNEDGIATFGIGLPINIMFTGVLEYMDTNDWIGIYPIDNITNNDYTFVSSEGKWLWISGKNYLDDIDSEVESPFKIVLKESFNNNEINFITLGNTSIELTNEINHANNPELSDFHFVRGTLNYSGDQVPWKIGKYIARYHLKGTYHVISQSEPFEIVCSKFNWDIYESTLSNYTSKLRDYILLDLIKLVRHCLQLNEEEENNKTEEEFHDIDENETLLYEEPKNNKNDSFNGDTDILSCVKIVPGISDSSSFLKYKESIARRIVYCIKIRYSIEFHSNVLYLSGNCRNLSERIIGAHIALRQP